MRRHRTPTDRRPAAVGRPATASRPAAGRRIRWLPRRTARLRLTALYGVLFLVSGAVLLVVAYVLVEVTGSPTGTGPSSQVRLAGPATGPSHAGMRAVPADMLQQFQQLQAMGDQRVVKAVLRELLIRSPIALAIVTVIALALGWIVAGRILRPLATITAAARRISASNLNERLTLHGPDDELKGLGDTLDELFARLEGSFEAQRHFVANASHELRTPLTRERAVLQVALDDPGTSNENWRATAREVLASNAEQESLIEALLTLATGEGGLPRREPVDLGVECDEALLGYGAGTGRPDVRLRASTRPATLDGDPLLVRRLAANLIGNAVRHNVTGGWAEVSTGARDGRAVLTVTNSGPVIPPGEVDRLFQPFQRLRPGRARHGQGDEQGHGLGLSIVRAIATAHGATVTLRARPAGGLAVDVTFPPATHPDGGSQVPTPPPGQRVSHTAQGAG